MQTCNFWVEKKQRYCKLNRKVNEQFCAEHSTENRNGRKRVACPYTSTHTVWEDQLENHREKCQKKPRIPTEPWHVKDINVVGSDGGITSSSGAEKIDLERWKPIVEHVYDTITETVEREVRNDEGLQERLAQVSNKKHAAQQASLIGNMGDLLNAGVIAEFGCGRGELSRYISNARKIRGYSHQQYLMVDRASPRRKFDSKIEHEDNGSVERLIIDIKDLDLSRILKQPQFEGKDCTIVSKHLCGCATDLTLECIAKAQLCLKPIRGLCIALCCRQLCTYETFPMLGRQYLESNGITKEGFSSLIKMTSYAVMGKGRGNEDGQEDLERTQLGLKARRIVDYARLLSVRKAFRTARLVEYVDSTISRENVCIIAAI